MSHEQLDFFLGVYTRVCLYTKKITSRMAYSRYATKKALPRLEWFSLECWKSFAFALVCVSTLGEWFKNSPHFLNKSKVKPKLIMTCSHTFSRTLRQLHVSASIFHWFTGLSLSFWLSKVITLVVVSRHSNENCSNFSAHAPKSRLYHVLFHACWDGCLEN